MPKAVEDQRLAVVVAEHATVEHDDGRHRPLRIGPQCRYRGRPLHETGVVLLRYVDDVSSKCYCCYKDGSVGVGAESPPPLRERQMRARRRPSLSPRLR